MLTHFAKHFHDLQIPHLISTILQEYQYHEQLRKSQAEWFRQVSVTQVTGLPS